MQEVRYNLKNKAEKETHIVLIFRYDGQKLVYYPGEKVRPSDWSDHTQRLKKSAGAARAAQVNRWLDIAAEKVKEIYRQHRNDAAPLPVNVFREMLDAELKGRTTAASTPDSLTGFISRIIAERKTNKGYSAGSIEVYRTVLVTLERFQADRKRAYMLDDIDLDFHADFIAYLTEKGFAPNYIHKQISTLKMFMGEAVDRGATKNQAWRSRRFSAKKEAVDNIVLTEEERETLLHFDFSDPYLQNAVDLFLVGCYTGQRYVDYDQILPEAIVYREGVPIIPVLQQKTKIKVFVPVFAELKTIFDRNGGGPPRTITNQRLNTYIKEACKVAGIDTPVTISRIRGGVRISQTKPKYARVTSHTARRTFATIEYYRAINEGRSYRGVMDILGHTNERQFFKYIGIDREASTVQFSIERGQKKAK